MPENRASFGYCHSILIILGLATISIALIVSAFSLALINENNQILQDATFSHFDAIAKTDRKAMRVARCDVGVYSVGDIEGVRSEDEDDDRVE
ncbi:hypothetical protein D6C95_07095 [Aureobasidium pullulans]|nr:hypothetical protein D6C95_07095 [Aureobasidium pullulans]